jgi:heme-degrading monooxygenase HmoA
MILETAMITVKPGSEEAFEQSLQLAQEVVAASPGFVSLEVRRGLERPNVYQLQIRWQTLEDHTVGFRESARFAEWRGHIGPHFAEAPFVEHFSDVIVAR